MQALRLIALLTCACLAGAASAGDPPAKVALTGARILPISGPPIDKGTVLIEQGRITAIGADVKPPYDARVFDLTGKTIMPGTVIASVTRGMDVPNESRPITPQLDIGDSLDPSQLFFEECLRLGETVVHVVPGDNTVIAGLGRVVRPIGLSATEMTLAEGQFMKLAVAPRAGSDRMVQMEMLREAFAELDDYLDHLAEKRYEEQVKKDGKEIGVGVAEARKQGKDLIRAEDIDEPHANLLRLRGGQVHVLGEPGPTVFKPLGAIIACDAAMDVGAAVRLAKEFGFLDRTVLVLGGDCYKAVKEIKAAARPIVLPENLTWRETHPFTGEVKETFLPKVFFDAGVPFSLVPGPDQSLPERMMTYQAARCVRAGIPRDEALRSITINPAKALGLESRFGTLEAGKDAHIVVFSGDPLDFNSVVEKVFVEGILAYEREKDARIQRLLQSAPAGKQED